MFKINHVFFFSYYYKEALNGELIVCECSAFDITTKKKWGVITRLLNKRTILENKT